MSDKAQKYEGKNINVYFEAGRCIHSRKCVLGLPHAFKANVPGPWIDPDAANADELAALISQCPSGALRYERNDDGAEETNPEINTATMETDGPLNIHAHFTLNAKPVSSCRASLCRCGASGNKPYCDGSHKDANFSDPGLASPDNVDTTLEAGVLDVQTLPDGPLLANGPLEIRDSAGQAIGRGKKAALCRCGTFKEQTVLRRQPYCYRL